MDAAETVAQNQAQEAEEVEETGKEEEGGEEEKETEEALDQEIENMKKRFKEMEDEVRKIEALQTSVEKSMKPPPTPSSTPAQDENSIYVGNVDYSTTNEELQAFFASCGPVVRVTILCDRWTGPKGYAYVEFKDADSVVNAMILQDTPFKNRPLKISPKRTNVPFFMRGRPRARGPPGYFPRRPPRGGGGYYEGGGGGGYRPRRPFRPRGRGYHPYYSGW